MPTPITHLEEGLKLTAESEIDLYEITLSNVESPTYVRFRDGPPGGTTTWGGKTWDHVPLKMSGFSRSSDDERSRPNMTVVNPSGVWNPFARDGKFDRASLVRYRVLKPHLENDVQLFQTFIWYISRVPSAIADQGLTFELRSLSDGPNQILPVRKYMPPEFPFVTLG